MEKCISSQEEPEISEETHRSEDVVNIENFSHHEPLGPVKLENFPNEVLVSIFLRLQNATVCRLRQTCRFVETFVEENRRRISDRPTLGISISFYTRYDLKRKCETMTFSLNPRRFHRYKKPYRLGENFGRMLSGISISKLYLYFSLESISVMKNLIAQIGNRLPFVTLSFPGPFPKKQCYEKLEISPSQIREIVELTDSVDCKGLISFGGLCMLNEEIVQALSQAKNCWKIRLEAMLDKYNSFEQEKHFYGYRVPTSTILRNLAESDDSGNLRRLGAFFYQGELKNFPQIEKLWESSSIPDHLLVINNTPKFIHLMETKSGKFAVIVNFPEKKYQWDNTPAFMLLKESISGKFAVVNFPERYDCDDTYIELIDGDAKLLFKTIMKSLGITKASESLRKEFLNAPRHHRQGIIRRAYLENEIYEVPMDNINMDDLKNLWPS